MIRTVYLAGPITQDPDGYVQKFRTAAAVLRSDGFDVINPVEIDAPEHAAEALDDPYGERYEELLERDLQIISRPDVEAVVVLPGWEKSRGAWREVDHACRLHKPILEYPNLNPAPVHEERERLIEQTRSALPTDSKARKDVPMARGLLDYFPAALAAVASVSKAGNDKHNPGEPMHHARGKSSDHADCIVRHMVDRGTVDPDDGIRHSAKVAWRALALLQEELEQEEAVPLARAAKL